MTARAELEDELSRFQPGHPRVATAEARIEALEAELDDLQLQLDALEDGAGAVDQLEMLIAADEETFRRYKARLDDALLSEVGSVYLTNARLIDRATPPERPKFSRLFLIMLSIPVGLGLGFGIAFIREYFDASLRSESEAEEAAGAPCFGSIPKVGLLRRLA